jgi:hypothetical protein
MPGTVPRRTARPRTADFEPVDERSVFDGALGTAVDELVLRRC